MPSFSSSASDSSDSLASLDERARTILDLLCKEHDFESASELIHPAVIVQHDDDEPRTSRAHFLEAWRLASETMPDFHMQIREAVTDETQRKVWVRSEITGLPGGIVKESIDMMTFNEHGLLIRSEDCQRVKKTV